VDVDKFVIFTIEESMLDTKKSILNELISVGIDISHDTIDKSKDGEEEVNSMSI
jgi:hypothetical protein